MIAFLRILPIALLLGACGEPPPATQAEAEKAPPAEPPNYVYLYARLHEQQVKTDAEAQYLDPLSDALEGYEYTAEVEEIRGTENAIEFIGIDFKIAAPESETEALETLLMNTLRLSGAPYATQIFIVTP